MKRTASHMGLQHYCFMLVAYIQWWMQAVNVFALDPALPDYTIPTAAGVKGLDVNSTGTFIPTKLPPRCQSAPKSCTIRNYYITAEEVIWDYAPSNEDRIHGIRLEDSETARITAVNGPGRIGHKYRKALYYGYTDATFKHRLPHPEWQGMIGPIIRAEVGDIIRVWFWNRASIPYSIHPHGVLYNLDSEGVWYAGSGLGGRVEPGGRFVYTWDVPARAGPAQRDRGSIMWGYHSHVKELMDVNSGLIGAIIIYRRGLLPGSGPEVGGLPSSGPALAPQDREFDREYVSFFFISDENRSHYIKANTAQFAHNQTNQPIPNSSQNSPLYDLNDPKFIQSNTMHAINGRIYGNLDGLVTHVGERVRWYIGAFGSMLDIHTAHFHGITVVEHGAREDTVDLLPGSFHTIDMVPDTQGKWLFHCHVDDHMLSGMAVFWRVLNANEVQEENVGTTAKSASKTNSTTRTKLNQLYLYLLILIFTTLYSATLLFN